MSKYKIKPKTEGNKVNVREKASLDSDIVTQFADGDVIDGTKVPAYKGWVKVDGGFVLAELCELIPKEPTEKVPAAPRKSTRKTKKA